MGIGGSSDNPEFLLTRVSRLSTINDVLVQFLS